MNMVQRQTTEQQQRPEQPGRILARKLGREINPEEAMRVTGGDQSLSGVYDRNTGKYKRSDDTDA